MNPSLSNSDLMEIESADPLSRFKYNMGADRLQPSALVAAAKAFVAGLPFTSDLTKSDREFIDVATAAAVNLLHSTTHHVQYAGAQALEALLPVTGTDLHVGMLLGHADDRVRAIGARHAPSNAELLTALAQDAAAAVRAAIASRSGALPEDAASFWKPIRTESFATRSPSTVTEQDLTPLVVASITKVPGVSHKNGDRAAARLPRYVY